MRPVRSMTTRLGVPRSLVAAHGDRQGGAGVVGIDADGERDAVLVQERLQSHRGHGVVVFEHGVQPQHGDGVAEGVAHALSLRQSVGDAARALSQVTATLTFMTDPSKGTLEQGPFFRPRHTLSVLATRMEDRSYRYCCKGVAGGGVSAGADRAGGIALRPVGIRCS